jgi:hypothetical protein
LRIVDRSCGLDTITAGFSYVVKKTLAQDIAGRVPAKNNIVIIDAMEIAQIPFQVAFA